MQLNKPITRRSFLKKSTAALAAAIAAGLLTGGYAYRIEPYWLEVTERTIDIPGLPAAFDGVRLLHFSDLHLGYHFAPAELADTVDAILATEPDLIAFTGDLADRKQLSIEQFLPELSRIKAPLGKYAVTGNHDISFNRRIVTDGLTEAGFEVLSNRHMRVDRDGASLYIAGVDDPWLRRADIVEATRRIPKGACTILLAHEPDFADKFSAYPIALQLSGHSHGGQVRLPLFGALYTPGGAQKYIEGLYPIGHSGMQLHVTRGIGRTRIPIRFACRPEIALLTLRKL